MDNQKYNTERLIKSLKKRKYVNNLRVFRSKDQFFVNYFALSGWIGNNYFHVTISKNKKIENVRIDFTTDCKEEIEKILIKFNLV